MQKDLISRQMAVETIMGQPPEPHWIPVSERLPDDDKEVLLCINNGELWLGWHNITWKTEEFYFDKEQVIAWMPLPEPYKGGETR